MAYSNFEDLTVWQRGLELSVRVYEGLKATRVFSLKDQIERSALSIPSNAKGSSGEFRTQVYLAKRLKILSEDESNWMIQESKEISRMLQGLIRSINVA